MIDDRQGMYSYSVYGILDFLSDLGGIIEIIHFLFSFALGSVAKHSFIIKALHQLFVMESKNSKFLGKTSECKHFNQRGGAV